MKKYRKYKSRQITISCLRVLLLLALFISSCSQNEKNTQPVASTDTDVQRSETPLSTITSFPSQISTTIPFTSIPSLAPSRTLTPYPYPTKTLTPTVQITPPVVNNEQYPRVDGSTSTLPLQVIMLCKKVNIVYEWENYNDDRGMFVLPTGDDAKVKSIQDWVVHTGTHPSYENLILGKTDFILVAREPSKDEIEMAEQKGVELEVTPVALDAFVFVLNVENPIKNLSLKNIRGIYTGEVKNWSELGGMKEDVRAFKRDPNSGSQELMEKLVMKGTPIIDLEQDMVIDMGGLINMVADVKNGIGYSVYYYVTKILPSDHVKYIAIDGIEPSIKNISNRSYPLTAEVYAVTLRGLPSSHPAKKLTNWMLSSEGKAVIEESGYIPVP